MTQKEQRYRATISFNITELTDDRAVKAIKQFVKQMNGDEDNDCKVVSVQKYPFGKPLGDNLLNGN